MRQAALLPLLLKCAKVNPPVLNRRNHTGFTPVELLIVIVVIAILATIAILAYNGIQERARDAQRMSDFAAIKQAL